VNEQIVTEAAGIDETVEKAAMLGRNGISDGLERLLIAEFRELRGFNTVAAEAFRASEPAPFGDERCVAIENAKQDLLVVAKQEDRSDALLRESAEPFDDLCRVRAAVDEVAEKHQKRLSGRPFRSIALNQAEELLEQIEAAVDVSDNIGPITPRPFGPGFIGSREIEDVHAELKRDSRDLRL
jgi:hypothetical protein